MIGNSETKMRALDLVYLWIVNRSGTGGKSVKASIIRGHADFRVARYPGISVIDSRKPTYQY